MSAARPLARLLPRRIVAPAAAPASFSTTAAAAYPRVRPSAVAAAQAQAAAGAAPARPPRPRMQPYTQEEIAELSEHYSPAQLHSLLTGESAIDPDDLQAAPKRRNDAMNLGYLDDLSEISPVLDLPVGRPPRAKIDKEGWPIPRQPLPMIEDPEITWPDTDPEVERLKLLSAHTGLSMDALRTLKIKQLVRHNVSNQTRMGKIRKQYSLAIAGNGDGLLGIGEGKAAEPEDAARQAEYNAIRNLEPIMRYENRTIFGDQELKVAAVEMKIWTRPPGFGVRCSSHIFEMCRAAGIHDISAKVTRSRNPMNVIKTFMHALRSQKLPETIARGRGKKFVDVRKVYYGQQL